MTARAAIDLAYGNESWTTGVHLGRPLAAEADVRVLHEHDRQRRAGVPLVWVESGVPWVPPPSWFDPMAAAWLIDTHRGLGWRGRLARGFDMVFVAQQRDANRLRAEGHAAHWLPLAAPDDLVPPTIPYAERAYDAAFVGQAPQGSFRRALLDHLASRISVAPHGGFVEPAEMMRLYANARVVLNVPLADDLNMRAFEAPAAGALLATETMDGLSSILPENTYALVSERTLDGWTSAIMRALAADDTAERAAEAQRAVLAYHTYRQRAATVVELIGEATARSNPADRARALGSAWAHWGRPGEVLRIGGMRHADQATVAVGAAIARHIKRRVPASLHSGGIRH